MRIKRKFQGVNVNRLKTNPDERLFAEAWQEENKTDTRGADVLTHLLHTGHQPASMKLPTKRDYQIAATMIQWLGSPVGNEWVRSVLARIDERKKRP